MHDDNEEFCECCHLPLTADTYSPAGDRFRAWLPPPTASGEGWVSCSPENLCDDCAAAYESLLRCDACPDPDCPGGWCPSTRGCGPDACETLLAGARRLWPERHGLDVEQYNRGWRVVVRGACTVVENEVRRTCEVLATCWLDPEDGLPVYKPAPPVTWSVGAPREGGR